MSNQADIRVLTDEELALVSGGDESHYEAGRRLGDRLEDIAEDVAEAAREAARKIKDWFDKTF